MYFYVLDTQRLNKLLFDGKYFSIQGATTIVLVLAVFYSVLKMYSKKDKICLFDFTLSQYGSPQT